MVVAQIWHARILLVAIGLGLPIDDASAGSQFEIGNPSPLQSSAELDITIVIPECMWLRRGEGASDETGSARTLVLPGNAQSQPWSVVGNGGTIVLNTYAASAEERLAAVGLRRDKVVDFTVAMP